MKQYVMICNDMKYNIVHAQSRHQTPAHNLFHLLRSWQKTPKKCPFEKPQSMAGIDSLLLFLRHWRNSVLASEPTDAEKWFRKSGGKKHAKRLKLQQYLERGLLFFRSFILQNNICSFFSNLADAQNSTIHLDLVWLSNKNSWKWSNCPQSKNASHDFHHEIAASWEWNFP